MYVRKPSPDNTIWKDTEIQSTTTPLSFSVTNVKNFSTEKTIMCHTVASVKSSANTVTQSLKIKVIWTFMSVQGIWTINICVRTVRTDIPINGNWNNINKNAGKWQVQFIYCIRQEMFTLLKHPSSLCFTFAMS